MCRKLRFSELRAALITVRYRALLNLTFVFLEYFLASLKNNQVLNLVDVLPRLPSKASWLINMLTVASVRMTSIPLLCTKDF